MTATLSGLAPFLVPPAFAAVVVAAGTWALVRRDRQLRAHSFRGRPPYGKDRGDRSSYGADY